MGILDKISNIFRNPQNPTAMIVDSDRIEIDSTNTQHLIPLSAWHKKMSDSEIKAFPLINEPMVAFANSGVFIHPYGVPPPVNYEILWTYFKYTPEIQAVTRAIVEDILSDGWILQGGRNNRLKAEKFLMMNFAKEQIASLLYDTMVTGDGYLFVQGLQKNEVKSLIDRAVENTMEKSEIKSRIADEFKSEIKHEVGEKLMNSIEEDEDIFAPRNMISVPSSTMRAQFDESGNLLQWVQKVGMRIRNYTAEEILHFRLLRLDGKFYGFTSLAAILKEMDILANVKDFARYYFEKGGVPNFMFILKNEAPNSVNTKNFQKSLQLFSSLANKYKSLVVTGEVDVKELNRFSKDMEFRELAKYLTQVIIMTYGVPVSRLSDVGLGDRVQARGSTISTEGYYRKISHIQDMLEDFLNMFILSKFKVTMKFNKTYTQDVVRDAQIDKMKTDTVEQRMTLGLMKRDDAAEYLGIDPEDLPTKEDIKEMEKLKMQTLPKPGGSPQFGQSKLNTHQVMSDSPEKMAQDSDKQAIAVEKKSTRIRRLDDNTFEIVE